MPSRVHRATKRDHLASYGLTGRDAARLVNALTILGTYRAAITKVIKENGGTPASFDAVSDSLRWIILEGE